MSGKRWSSDRRSDQSEGEAGSCDECRTHVWQLMMEPGRSKTCSCEAERERG